MKSFKKLQELNWKINNLEASSEEKLEYIQLLYDNGNITSKQLESYKKGKNVDDILKGAMLIGGAVLVARIFKNLLEEKECPFCSRKLNKAIKAI